MPKIPFLHFSKNSTDLKKSYFLALIPLLLFGFYKNGLLLYFNNLISFKEIFLPLYFYLISLVVSLLVAKLAHKSSFNLILTALLCSCTISLNTNVFIYPILLFVLLFIFVILSSKFTFNIASLTRLGLILALLLNSYSYLNIAEHLKQFNYNAFDHFLGHHAGGIASTSTLLVLLGFIILATNRYYKKSVALSSTLSYALTLLVLYFITSNSSYLTFLLSGGAYFSFVFFASDYKVAPLHLKAQTIYGLVIGFLTAILSNLLLNEASYLAIFLTSLFIPLLNKVFLKKDLQA